MNVNIYTGLSEAMQHAYRFDIKESDPVLIIKAVCSAFDMTEEVLLGRIRKREFTEPRYIAIGLILRANPTMTLKYLGNMFHRDHSTIIYARETFAALMETNKQFQKKVSLVKQRL